MSTKRVVFVRIDGGLILYMWWLNNYVICDTLFNWNTTPEKIRKAKFFFAEFDKNFFLCFRLDMVG